MRREGRNLACASGGRKEKGGERGMLSFERTRTASSVVLKKRPQVDVKAEIVAFTGLTARCE